MPASVPESLIIDAGALDDLISHLRQVGRFAADTEFVSEDTFEPVLGLIQIATSERVAAIDPMAIDDLSAFWDVLTDPEVEVVMFASGEDLRICRHQAGRLPQRVVDLQVAAGLIGYPYPMSLGNLLGQALRVSVAGGETRTDWRRRPLTDAQVRYALDDVRWLLPLADQISRELAERGRLDWAEQEYQSLLRTVEARSDSERWRRLPGLHQLNRRGLEAARRLWEWRQDEARRADRPVRQVMRDDLLLAIAKRQPGNRRDLEALRDFNRPHLLQRSQEILKAVADAQSVAPEHLPEHAERHEDLPGQTMVVSLLQATLNQSCSQRQVAASLVGSSADLKELIRWHVAGRSEAVTPWLLEGWRGEVCGSELLDVIAGRRSLRIVDPTSEIPVRLDPTPDH